MTTKITVLGAGSVGSLIAADLARNPDFILTLCDANSANLAPFQGVVHQIKEADLSRKASLEKVSRDADIVVGALPGFMGYRTLKRLIEEGKHVVDVSFMPEDPLTLADFALKHDATVLVDMGVAPGLSNLIVGHAARLIDNPQEVKIYVGGLPVERTLPFQYKAPFSPVDVIEEYMRPARFLDAGRVKTVPPLTEIEHLEIPGVGTLEAFFTDGLRTLLTTLTIPNMVEKTLRYPGHAEAILALKKMGFFGEELIQAGEVKVRPFDLTTTLLLDHWKLDPGEKEFTVMLIKVLGGKKNGLRRVEYTLLDFFDPEIGFTSMARTTGYPAAIAATLMAEGKIQGPGIIVPENLGQDDEIYEIFINRLADRGIHLKEIKE